MGHSLRIGTIAGIPIRVHWSFGLLVALVAAVTVGAGAGEVAAALGWVALLFASVVFHELAHAMVARRRGIAVKDIVLLPIGGVSEIPDLGRTPDDEWAISIAGPISSVVLAVAFGLLAVLVGASLWPPTLFAGSILVRLAWVNLVLAAFNFLPALPLDGGRVLRASLSRRRGEQAGTAAAAKVGQVLAVAMVVVGMLVDVWLVLIGIFVFLGARSEAQVATVKAAMGGCRVGDLAAGGVVVLAGTATVADALGGSPASPAGAAAVVQDGDYLGMVYSPDLARLPPGAHLADVADHQAPLLDPTMALYPQAWQAFALSRRPVLAVGTGGRVRGLLYLDDVQRTLERALAVQH